MKTKLTFAFMAFLTSTAFAEFKAPLPEFKNEKQLAEWRAEKSSEATSQSYAVEETAFYTGKPYLASSGGYAFRFRSYNPELARWTSGDPSGFPDGANNNYYAPIPTNGVDWGGLLAIVISTPRVTVNNFNASGVILNGFNYLAVTNKGNHITVFLFQSINKNNPPPPGSGQPAYDFTQNCHGFVFLPGFWIDNSWVNTILADEYKETDEKHASFVEYGGNDHSANVKSRNGDGTIKLVEGKVGYFGVKESSLEEAWPLSPKFYE